MKHTCNLALCPDCVSHHMAHLRQGLREEFAQANYVFEIHVMHHKDCLTQAIKSSQLKSTLERVEADLDMLFSSPEWQAEKWAGIHHLDYIEKLHGFQFGSSLLCQFKEDVDFGSIGSMLGISVEGPVSITQVRNLQQSTLKVARKDNIITDMAVLDAMSAKEVVAYSTFKGSAVPSLIEGSVDALGPFDSWASHKGYVDVLAQTFNV